MNPQHQTVDIFGHTLSLDAACPCGSSKALVACCWDPASERHRMLPTPSSAVSQPDAYAHPGCYARVTMQCSRTISKEHYITNAILKYVDEMGALNMKGLPWRDGLPRSALTAKVLCSAHNNALSPLDSVALRFFKTLHEHPPGPHLFHALDVERWLLKTLCGLLAAGGLRRAPDTKFSLSKSALGPWVDYLFGGAPPPPPAGLYVKSAAPVGSKPRFAFAPLSTGPAGTGFQAELCGAKFWLVTAPVSPEPPTWYRSFQLSFKESGCSVIVVG